MKKASKTTVIPGRKADGAKNVRPGDGRNSNGGTIINNDTVVIGGDGDVEMKGNSAKGGSVKF